MEIFATGFVGILHEKYGNQVWTLGKVRKEAECRFCGKPLHVGASAFRPTTNQDNRGHRVCDVHCLEAYERESGE